MGKESYDIEWEVEEFHWWFVIRRRLLRSILSSLIPSRLSVDGSAVDIGCGAGPNLKVFKSLGFHGVGVDQSQYALHLASRKLEIPLIAGNLNNLPFRSESVGLIVATDVLEHLENDAEGLREIYRALKKKGILILTVPAFRFLWGAQDVLTGHKRRYSMNDILNRLRQEGFEITRSTYFNFFLFFPILLARRLIYLLGLSVESENKINSPFINFLLKEIFSMEVPLLRFCSFPFGVSILCIAEKGRSSNGP